MENTCHKILPYKTSDFINDLTELQRISIPNGVKLCNAELFIKKEILEQLSDLGDLSCVIFKKKPNVNHKKYIHIDSIDGVLGCQPCLNIVVGSGVMKWYAPSSKPFLHKNALNLRYFAYYKDWGNPIDEWINGGVALVKIDIPHQVWNYSEYDRYCLSLRWKKLLTWDEITNWFETKFKINNEI